MNNGMARQAARLLLLPTWMIAFAILVKGYSDSGDGFSAGVIAALGVIMQYVTYGTAIAEKLRPVRYARQIAHGRIADRALGDVSFPCCAASRS